MYFQHFGKILYDPIGDNNPKLMTNIMSRVRVRANMKKEMVMLDPYDIQEGETPEIVADKHHGSPYYHWVVMLLNNISDVYHDWPKSTRKLQQYLTNKHTDTQLDEAHHYEVAQSSGGAWVKIKVESDVAGAVAVTNYEYEATLQDVKREIRILQPQFLGQFKAEFGQLLEEAKD